MKIEVTAEDIEHGVPCDSCRCPIARALARAGFSQPDVDGSPFFLDGGASLEWIAAEDGTRRTKRLPDACAAFAAEFDSRKPVEPFSFELDATP